MPVLIRSPRGAWWCAAMTLVGVGVFAFAVGVLMLPHSAVLGDRLPELTCLQVAFTPARATAIVSSFTAEQQLAVSRLLVPGDVTFAWGYGLVLAGLVGLLARRLEGRWQTAGAIVMWLPLVASLLDVTEDLFLHAIVATAIEHPAATVEPALPALAGIAATVKYVALAILTPAYSIAGILRGLMVDRRAGALLVYFLLLLACISMVMRPLQQIPDCF